jgi:hypothetical protein
MKTMCGPIERTSGCSEISVALVGRSRRHVSLPGIQFRCLFFPAYHPISTNAFPEARTSPRNCALTPRRQGTLDSVAAVNLLLTSVAEPNGCELDVKLSSSRKKPRPMWLICIRVPPSYAVGTRCADVPGLFVRQNLMEDGRPGLFLGF